MTVKSLPSARAIVVAATLLVAGGVSAACNNYQEQLARSEHHYENARYEAALTNLEDLEIHVPGLSRSDRVRYGVVRGMTHLRLEQRADARHWLAIAREEARPDPRLLSESSRTNIDRTIGELDPLNPAPSSAAGDGGAP
jgi:hypothetical protein